MWTAASKSCTTTSRWRALAPPSSPDLPPAPAPHIDVPPPTRPEQLEKAGYRARCLEAFTLQAHSQLLEARRKFSEAGSSYDGYARLLARYMPEHIPGAPSLWFA